MSDTRYGEAVLAGFWVRVVASILDAAWMIPASYVLASIGLGLKGGTDLSPGADILLNLIWACVVILFWVTRQATPGKMLLRLRVVDAATGGVPPWPRLALRYFGYLLSAIPLGFGYLWMIRDGRRQCWHDKLGGTLVVRDPVRA
ncbi:RDD family protein [Roseomonas sp. CCTCC AB2023176]|uniref:RDD family protein n=1 Tax=Roseomonas sp. CCTCC AB2023176 TaxID=3342640 RepID=UPI0035D6BB20